MKIHFQKMFVVAAFVAIQMALPVKNLHAGPFIDWLLGRPILTYPAQPTVAAPVLAPTSAAVTAGYPTAAAIPVNGYTVRTANYAAAPTAAGCPCPVTTNYAPATACANPCAAPATTAYMPVQPVQYSIPTTVGYAPAYRSTWYRVPITYYRPVTAYTGVGAQPVTVMQPCNTQTYQVQRTPLLFHRPWLPATTAAPVATYAPVVTQPTYPSVAAPVVTAPATPNCPCPNAAAVAPSLTTPSYVPSTTVPSTAVPSASAPSAHIPSYSDAIPGASSVPADQPPALQQYDPAQPTYPNSAATSTPGAASSASTQRMSPNTASSVYQVKPIPDPHVNQPTSPAPVAPPLLNPRERTASQVPTRLPNVSQAVYKTPVSNPAPSPAPKKQPLWDDSGWHSVAR